MRIKKVKKHGNAFHVVHINLYHILFEINN